MYTDITYNLAVLNAVQDEGYGAEESESAVGSSIEKEGEAGACDLGIRYITLQAIYAGKLNRQSIQVISTDDIMSDIITFFVISLLISPMISDAGQKNICWTDGQRRIPAIPPFYRQGVLGRASSQACPPARSALGYFKTTKYFVQ
jgi:hypothetical protein